MTLSNFRKLVEKHRNEFFSFLHFLLSRDKKLLILGDLAEAYVEFKSNNKISNKELDEIVERIHEAIISDHRIHVDVRIKIGYSEFFFINVEEKIVEQVPIKDYLINKERFINPNFSNNILNLNFKPFYDKSPSVRDVESIGNGVEHLNKFLSSQMFNNSEKWQKVLFDFIKLHKHRGRQLILNDRLTNPEELDESISKALKKLAELDEKDKYESFKHMLQNLGFEIGLGKNVKEVTTSLNLLKELLNSPDNVALKEFISRIPMIFNITVVSSHGYFAQEGVLGMPDTGGQVVYILDQVKELEKTLIKTLKRAGLDILPKIIILTRLIPNAGKTTCNQRLEKVRNTKNTWILRVPFKKHNPKVTDNWISRFEIWPYLEEFAEESYYALKAEFGGRPDLIIGNYSDGNLVSYLLSKKFDVTQCCIAHALEKSKYLFSDLYWNELEDHYNFSLQFTADLIAMNSSDFQITSTYQEIAGTEYTVGQYETHKHFTLPGLYRVENGVNLYHTKFNIISPGVNEKIYFPYTKANQRIDETKNELQKLIFENQEDQDVVGTLNDPDKIPLFSMARLDKNKNLIALVRWFGKSEYLQEHCNLVIVAGQVDVSKSSDKEEIEQINIMHEYIDKYNLHDKIRWIGKLFRKDEAGEVYRLITDRKGVFVQPGLFEGFGLTVLEAMTSGCPVVATKYGGPLEIIQDNKNGFHIDPVNDKECIEVLESVIEKMNEDSGYWDEISKNSIKRVEEKYNWKLYTDRLLSQAKIYGFWKFSTDLQNKDMEAYLDLIYHLLYKTRANQLLLKHSQVE